MFGVLALGRRITGIAGSFASAGSNVALIRFVPEHSDAERKESYLGLSYLLTFTVSLVAGFVLYLLAPTLNRYTLGVQVFVPVLRVLSVFLVSEGFTLLLKDYFRALEEVRVQVLISRILRPSVWLTAASAAFLFDLTVLPVAAVGAAVSVLVTAVAAYFSLAQSDLRPRINLEETADLFNYSLPILFSRLGELLQTRADILMVGVFLTAADTGVYEISLFLSSFISVPLYAFNQLTAPIASRLHSSGEEKVLKDLYSTATRWITTFMLLIAVFQLVYSSQLLGLFGEEFRRGGLVLAILVLGNVAGSISGATEWLLRMTDHQYLSAINHWILGLLNLGLIYYLVNVFGIEGVALSTAATLVLVNLVRLSELYYFEDLQPWNTKYLKPIASAILTAAMMKSLSFYLSGVLLLVSGALIGTTVYFAALYSLGIEEEDMRFLGKVQEEKVAREK